MVVTNDDNDAYDANGTEDARNNDTYNDSDGHNPRESKMRNRLYK